MIYKLIFFLACFIGGIIGCTTTGPNSKSNYWNLPLPHDRQVVGIEERQLDGDVPQMIIRTEKKSTSSGIKKGDKDNPTEKEI